MECRIRRQFNACLEAGGDRRQLRPWREVHEVDPDVAVQEAMPLTARIGFMLFPQRFAATLTGVFYPRAEPMTYTVDFADYGTEKDITAP